MEKDIYVLQETLESYIKNNIFSSNLTKQFSLQFKRLVTYMDKNSIGLYSKKVGREYLAFGALSGNNGKRSETAYNFEAR